MTFIYLFAFFMFTGPALALFLGRSRGVMARDAEELHRTEVLDIDAFERARHAYTDRAKLRLGMVFGSMALFWLWAFVSMHVVADEYHGLTVAFVGVVFGGAWVSVGLPLLVHDVDKLSYVNGHETSYVYANGTYEDER